VDRIKVSYHTTANPPLDNYASQTIRARKVNLSAAKFSRTWIKRADKSATIIPPRLSRIHTDLYLQRIPNAELDEHLLIRNVSITNKGRLSHDTLKLAATLASPHHLGAGGPDDYVYS
jgi:hypothetical protein